MFAIFIVILESFNSSFVRSFFLLSITLEFFFFSGVRSIVTEFVHFYVSHGLLVFVSSH